jgi:hypothetical protein
MAAKHFSDVLFDYLLEKFSVSCPDEDTAGIMQTTAESRDLGAENASPDTKGE